MRTQSLFTLTFLASLATAPALAGAVCMGQTFSGKIVTVSVNTVGTMGSVRSATVEIKKADGSLEKTYSLEKLAISQYFEGCRANNCKQSIVGLAAYYDANWPVTISFVGTDFFEISETGTQTLEQYLKSSSRKKEPGNSMRVWKGDESLNFEKAFYDFSDVVCELDHDV